MSTGDLRNNLRKLQHALKAIGFVGEPDLDSLTKGIPAAFLPLYHHVFVNHSQPLSKEISDLGIELYGKTDLRFIEGMYKVLRELFSYKPPITKDQFFTNGYAERKIIMCTEILSRASQRHKQFTAPKHSKSKSAASICSASKSTSRLGPRPASTPAQPKTKNSHATFPPGQSTETSGAANQDQTSETFPVAHNIINEVRHPTNTSKPARKTALPRQRPQYKPSSYGQSTHVTVRTKAADDLDEEIGLAHMEGLHRMSTTPADIMAMHEVNGFGFEGSGGSSQVEVVTVNKGSNDGFIAKQKDHLRPIDVVALTPKASVRCSQHVNSTCHGERDSTAVASTAAHFRAMDQTIRELNARIVQLEETVALKDKKLETALAKVTLLENRVSLLESKVTASSTRGQTTSPEQVPVAGTGTRVIQGTTQILSGQEAMLSNNHSQAGVFDTDSTSALGSVFCRMPAQDNQSSLEEEKILPPSPIPIIESRKMVTDAVNSSSSPAVEPTCGTSDKVTANGKEACASTPTEPQFGMTDALEKHFQSSVIKDQKTRICRMLQETEDLLHIEVASPGK